MKKVTLYELNKNDNPKDFCGELLCDDGRNQLWKFGEKFANRTEYEDGGQDVDYIWDNDLDGWNPDGLEMDEIE